MQRGYEILLPRAENPACWMLPSGTLGFETWGTTLTLRQSWDRILGYCLICPSTMGKPCKVAETDGAPVGCGLELGAVDPRHIHETQT